MLLFYFFCKLEWLKHVLRSRNLTVELFQKSQFLQSASSDAVASQWSWSSPCFWYNTPHSLLHVSFCEQSWYFRWRQHSHWPYWCQGSVAASCISDPQPNISWQMWDFRLLSSCSWGCHPSEMFCGNGSFGTSCWFHLQGSSFVNAVQHPRGVKTWSWQMFFYRM